MTGMNTKKQFEAPIEGGFKIGDIYGGWSVRHSNNIFLIPTARGSAVALYVNDIDKPNPERNHTVAFEMDADQLIEFRNLINKFLEETR